MAAKIDGLVIEIGANTSSFKQSMRDVQNEAKGISKDLKTVSESLKLDPENVGKAADKLKLLKDQAENATKKVEVIKKAIEALNKEYDDKSSKEYTDQLHKLEAQLESATREQELANQKVKQFSENAGEAGKSAFSLGDAIKGHLISDAIKSGLQSVVNLAKNLASHLAQAVKDLANGVWNWANAGANLIETENKVDAVFKEASKSVKEWADDAAHNVRVTKQVAMETASSFGNIFTNMGMATDKAADYSTQLIEVAAAQADFNNISTEEVLQKIQSALTGNYQGLKALGIVMNEDKVIEKALAMTHKQNKDELTELEKTMARVELIFDGSANAVEKFKENSGSLISLTAELKSRFGDLRDEIGAKLTPIFEQLFQKIADYLSSEEGQKMLDSIVEKVGKISEKIQEFVENGKLEEWITKFKEEIPQIISDLTDLAKIVGDLVQPILDVYHAIQGYNDLKNLDEAVKSSKKEVHAFAESMDIDMDTLRNAIKGYSEQQGISLTEIYGNWSTYQPRIAEYMAQTGKNSDEMKNQVTTATGEMASQTKTDLDATASAFQDGLTRAGNADTSGLRAKTEEVETLGSRIKTALANFIDNSGWFQNAPGAEYARRASGGPVSAGHIYQVNDDAARRKEFFIPYTNGYILNASDTERIINNNTNNSRSYGDLVVNVNSYGTDAATIADEIGQAVNRRLRMSGIR